MIRPLQPADRDEWLRMRGGPRGDDVDAFFATGRLWHLPSTVYVADRGGGGGGPLGGFVEVSLRPYARGCVGDGPVGYVEEWFVDADLRRTGVGTRLIAAAEQWARDSGCREMGSDCHSSNHVSRRAHASLRYVPADDEVSFRKPLAAGDVAPGRQWTGVVPMPLDAGAITALVSDPEAGGIDVFLGTTRAERHSRTGATLVALAYEAYYDMAEQQLRDLAAAARQRWPVRRIAVVHRVGRVAVGEPSVVIAVSTPHRGASFDACRWVIDSLKRDVAIWKQEVWAEGEATWVAGQEAWMPRE